MSRRNYERPERFDKLPERTIKRRRHEEESTSSTSSHSQESDSGSGPSSIMSLNPSSSAQDLEPTNAPVDPPLLLNPIPENPPLSEVESDSDSNAISDDSSVSSIGDYFERSDDEADDAVVSVENKVRQWSIVHNIPHTATSDLLRRLRRSHSDCFRRMHIDARTIVHTPSERVKTDPVPPGDYYHIGIKPHLEYVLSLLPLTVTALFMVFCFDGFSIAESNFAETWPILVCFPNFEILRNLVFPIGIYSGPGKPDELDGYLRAFVNELKDLLAHGFTYEGRLISIIPTLGICCDTSARTFITGTKGHGGFHCCAWCKVIGITFKNRRIYLQTTCSPRTDNEFRTRADPDYRLPDKSTPLQEIQEIDFVKSLILDPMHLLFLGVMKTLMSTWLNGHIPHKFSVSQRQEFLNDIKRFKSYIPSFFKRKLQAIKINKKKDSVTLKLKSKEYRLFLLYVGPVLLKKYLTVQKYNNFLELHIAVFILYGRSTCSSQTYRDYARNLLVHFVEKTPEVYGSEFVSFTFHALIHLVDIADNFAEFFPSFTLNDISCFPFENFLFKLKKMVRGPARSLSQMAKRLEERSRCKMLESVYGPGKSQPQELTFEMQHNEGPLLPSCENPLYRKAVSADFNLSVSNDADCYCRLSNGSIVKVENFAFSCQRERVLIGRYFTDITSYYGDPFLDSAQLGIYKGKRLSELRSWTVSSIAAQYMGLPDGNENIILLPLLHCLF